MERKAEKVIGKFVYAKCNCGSHLIDLFDKKWNDNNLGFYTCNNCDRPLVCRGDDGSFYFVGAKVL